MQSTFFVPYLQDGSINYTNLVILEGLTFFFVFCIISLLEFYLKKILFYGRNENPSIIKAIYWGLVVGLLFIFVLNMHLFHIINWTIGGIISIIVIISLFLIGVL